jgi:hypothetical protein
MCKVEVLTFLMGSRQPSSRVSNKMRRSAFKFSDYCLHNTTQIGVNSELHRRNRELCHQTEPLPECKISANEPLTFTSPGALIISDCSLTHGWSICGETLSTGLFRGNSGHRDTWMAMLHPPALNSTRYSTSSWISVTLYKELLIIWRHFHQLHGLFSRCGLGWM